MAVRFKKGEFNEVVTVTFEGKLRVHSENVVDNDKIDDSKLPPSPGVVIYGKSASIDMEKFSFKVPNNTHLPALERARLAVQTCSNFTGTTDFDGCILYATKNDIEIAMGRKHELKTSRDLMAERLRNYTCADPNFETSPTLYTKTVNAEDSTLNLNVLFDSSHAKIWTADNFINENECDILRTYGKPKLTRATVADVDGGAIVSESRKAQQARYFFNSGKKLPLEEDPLYVVFKKIYNITNQMTGYGLSPEGQEGFMIIQYDKTDEYAPHCDGSCDDDQVQKGGRIATAVVYCTVPEVGGGTTFTKADVFVKPKQGMVTFFAYKGPDNMMDPGFTEHSGCPVIVGEKWISTAWMRYGVTVS